MAIEQDISTIYKAYDIRGFYPQEINAEIIRKVAYAFAYLRNQETKNNQLVIAVGRDMRESSPELTKAVIAGLLAFGVTIIDLGLVSTPTFYFAVAFYGYDGGIMVSASHNPGKYNGCKLVRDHAAPIGLTTGLRKIAELTRTLAVPTAASPAGSVTKKDSVLSEQVKTELKHFNQSNSRQFTIVADAGNGMGSLYLQALFERLPVKLIPLYWQLDGTFPNHPADPLVAENLHDLQQRVIKEKADLGIATDGDGDRIFFVDNNGAAVPAAVIRGIMAKAFLAERPGAKIGYDVRPGRITRDMIVQYGGTPVITRVGHSLIKQQMLKENIYFAGESSGHYYLQSTYGCFEAPMIVVMKLLNELAREKLSLTDYVQPLLIYSSSGEINRQVKNADSILQSVAKHYTDGKVSFLDGVSVEYDDWWFNLRKSNTEPLVRLNVEAKTADLMQEKTAEILALIDRYDRSI